MHDHRSGLGRALDAHIPTAPANFDHGGTPAFRARQTRGAILSRRSAAFWIPVRILWIIPALVPLAAFVAFFLWLAVSFSLGHDAVPAWVIGAIAVLLAVRCLPPDAISSLPLAMNRPTRQVITRGNAIGALVRCYVMTVYGWYAFTFWVCLIAVGIALI